MVAVASAGCVLAEVSGRHEGDAYDKHCKRVHDLAPHIFRFSLSSLRANFALSIRRQAIASKTSFVKIAKPSRRIVFDRMPVHWRQRGRSTKTLDDKFAFAPPGYGHGEVTLGARSALPDGEGNEGLSLTLKLGVGVGRSVLLLKLRIGHIRRGQRNVCGRAATTI
jgi:hypothetical protein